MTLLEQKNIFLQTTKAQKAITYARKWFNDFVDSKLSEIFLAGFYQDSIANDGTLYDDTIATSYGALFWFWFHKRYERLQTEADMANQTAQYEAEMKDIESSNPLNMLGDLFSFLTEKFPYILAIGLGLYMINIFRSKR